MDLKERIEKVDTDKQLLEALQAELPILEKKLKETNEELGEELTNAQSMI